MCCERHGQHGNVTCQNGFVICSTTYITFSVKSFFKFFYRCQRFFFAPRADDDLVPGFRPAVTQSTPFASGSPDNSDRKSVV